MRPAVASVLYAVRVARQSPRDTFTSVLEVVGALLVVVGCVLVWLPLGFLAAGAGCLGAGWLLAPEPARGDRR